MEDYNWECLDQGTSAGLCDNHNRSGDDFEKLDEGSCLEETDDVFLSREDTSEEEEKMASLQLRRQPQVQDSSSEPFYPRRHMCSVEWSLSHRCIDCAWRNHRGGRPHHPPLPIISPSLSSPPLVTLQSLSTTRDSGYEPSPTSAYSFTFTSDEEDTEVEGHSSEDEDTRQTTGISPSDECKVTPPIRIPTKATAKQKRQTRLSRSKEKHVTVSSPVGRSSKGRSPIEKETKRIPNEESRGKVIPRKRSKSMPELGGNELLLQRTPIVIRNTSYLRTPVSNRVSPIHGRNYSLPATTPDGRPLLGLPPSTPSSRASREGLIDLTEEDPEGSAGHRRRVFVLALPDIIVDAVKTDSFATTPLSPSEGSSTSSAPSSARRLSRIVSMPVASYCSDDGSEVVEIYRPRPAWRRPRALSCDVTLEVEVGQELRKIADNFSRETLNTHGGVWRQFRNSIVRRLSLGTISPAEENNSSLEERGTQSLPSSPGQPSNLRDSDFEDSLDSSS